MTSEETATGGTGRRFGPTLWTVVLTAKDPASPRRREALEALVQTYWKPLYYFVRRRGNDSEASKDITQGFFTALIEKNYLKSVDRDRGKFRSFLLAALEHYLADEYDRAKTLKRGGGKAIFSLAFEQAESEGLLDRATTETPTQVYQREWALRVLAQAMQSLRTDYEGDGRTQEFESIKVHLGYGASRAASYAELAVRLGLSESDVRNRIHRARVRFREAILEVIRSYTRTEEDSQEELRDLLGAFS